MQEVDYVLTPESPDERWTFYYNELGETERAELDGFDQVGPPDGVADAVFTYGYDEQGRLTGGTVDGAWGSQREEWLGLLWTGPSGQELGGTQEGGLLGPSSVLADAGPPDRVPDERWAYAFDEQGRRKTLFEYEDGELQWTSTLSYEDGRLVEVRRLTPDGWGYLHRYE